jgi:hypothetical protein
MNEVCVVVEGAQKDENKKHIDRKVFDLMARK